MKTIEQQVTVQFHTISVKDAITILPVIDELISKFHSLCSQFNEMLNKTEIGEQHSFLDIAEEATKKYDQIMCLINLGFESSTSFTLQKHEALTIAHHCGFGEEVRICMENGFSPTAALSEFDLL